MTVTVGGQVDGGVDIAIRLARGPAFAGAAALLALWGCSRGPPPPAASPEHVAQAPALESELAGGPPRTVTGADVAEVPAAPPGPEAAPDAPIPTGRTAGGGEMIDPLQPINRRLFRADRAVTDFMLDKTPVLKVIARTPPRARTGLTNAFQNLDEPRAAANHLLQRSPGRALRAAARFLINSTVGVAGLIDVAQKLGLKHADADFGRTLASYGVRPGVYLYMPLSGPSCVRDLVGSAVDGYFWPLHWLSLGQLPQRAIGVALAGLAQVQPDAPPRAAASKAGPDPYLAVRQAYQLDRQPPQRISVAASRTPRAVAVDRPAAPLLAPTLVAGR